MSDDILSGPLPISGHRKPPFDVPGQPRLEFPFIRKGYWEQERSKFKAQEVAEIPQSKVAAKVVLPREKKRQEQFL